MDIPFRPNLPVRPGTQLTLDENKIYKGRTYAVNVCFDVWSIIKILVTLVQKWQIVVDNHIDLQDIDTPCDNVGRNKDLRGRQ
jgi:hypothetical protein